MYTSDRVRVVIRIVCCVFFCCCSAALAQVNSEIADLQQQVTELQSLVERGIATQASLESPVYSTSYPNAFVGCSATECGQATCDNGGLFVSAGFDFVFAKPHLKESFEATSIDVVNGRMTMVPFDFSYDVTPRAWLHLTTDGGPGLRGRYWQYDHGAAPQTLTASATTFPGASAVTVIFPSAISALAPGDRLDTSTKLDVSTIDFEGTVPIKLGGLQLLGSAGLRIAEIDQQSGGTITSGTAVTQSLFWNRSFDGLGLTIAGDGRYPLGNSGFALVSNARGSLLFGQKTIARTVMGDVTPPPNTTVPMVSLVDADEVSGIFEVAVGAEWSRELNNGMLLFARGQYEGQLWTAAGAPTLTFLGFEGFSIGLGLCL